MPMPMPGMPPGMMGGGPPMGGPPGGGEQSPMMEAGLAAMEGLRPKSANPTTALAKVDEAMKLAYRLVMSALPQVSQWNPKAAKDLHQIGRQIISIQESLQDENPSMQPPPNMMMGGMPAGGTPTGSPFGATPGQY